MGPAQQAGADEARPTIVPLRRRRGGQHGNQNARKHGGYSEQRPTEPADWLTGNLSGILQSIVRNHPPERRHVALRDALSRMGLKRHELQALQLAIKLELSQ